MHPAAVNVGGISSSYVDKNTNLSTHLPSFNSSSVKRG